VCNSKFRTQLQEQNQYKITSKDTGIRSTFFIILRRTEFHSQPVMSAQQNLELYRRSTLGMALTDALDDMVTSGELAPLLAMKVLAEFDKSMASELKTTNSKLTVKGNLHTYRFCDNVWTFLLEDVCLKSVNSQGNTIEHSAPSMKIVACDGKILGDAAGHT